MAQNGGRFDFDDGGSYSGGWLEGKAHGYGVCTGPKGQGEYAGAWVRGFEESGVYTWPSGNTYSGEWQDGKRHGVGVEIKGHWVYRGEWSQGYKGRYGVRQSTISCARYEGTWTTSFQDGYGVETYVDEGTYQGQWQRGMRHGLGIRHSAPFGIAAQYRDKQHLHGSLPSSMNSHASMATMEQQRGRSGSSDVAVTDRHRGGFVLTGRSTPGFNDAEQIRSRSSSSGRSFAERFRLRRGQSTGDLPRSVHHSTGASPTVTRGGVDGRSALGGSGDTGHGLLGSNVDIADGDVTETYMGEWKTDKRSGYGVSERSDGLKYVGEWFNDKKFGYGVTTLKDGTKEEGKYKDNELITSGKKRKLFGISRTRLRDRVDGAIVAASRAAEMAQQRAVVAATRRANARQRAESSDKAAMKALSDADLARDEADKFLQHTPQTTTVPVNQETRVRMLPGQEERSSVHGHRRHPPHDQGRTTGGGESEAGKTSRLLPPRQESSDSYTSNQSSSVGSSSAATTSPPPPKPPRSSPSTVDGGGGHQEGLGPADGDATRYPSRDEPPPGRTPQALPSQVVVSRTAVPLFNRGPGNVSRLDQHQQQHPSPANHATRPSVDDRGYSQTLDARSNQAARTNLSGGSGGGGATSADRRSNSFRNFRSSAPMERSSYVDVSDSGDSGHQSSSRTLRAVVAGEGGHQPGSPQILLHPATPTGRQNSQRAPPQSGERARLRSSSDEAPPPPAPSRSQAMPVDPTRRTVSPVLSDRQYQQPISLVLSRDSDSSSRDRDLIFDNHHQQHHRQVPNNDYYAGDAGSGTRLPPDSFPARHLPQMPSSSSSNTAGIPTRQPNSSNSRSSSAAPSSSGGSFRSHADSRGREYRSGTSSPKTWDRMSRQRRETLPSIVQYPPQPSTSSKPGLGGAGGDHRQSSKEMYLIENGVRRRLVSDSGVWGTPSMTSEREPPLLQRFVVEETPSGVGGGGLEKRGIKSSLPDVRRVRETTELIPREQMSVLSQRRRDEMRREREERERETVIIRLVDIKTWCKENQLIVFLVALNLSLAAMFLSFLTRSKDTTR